jgi:hypothetical protein
MPSMVEALKAAAFKEVTCEGVEYLLEAFTARDLMRLEGQFNVGIVPPSRSGEERPLTPEQQAARVQVMETAVAASLRALRAEGEKEWERIEVVLRASEEAGPSNTEGASRIFIGRLPALHVRALFEHSWVLSGGSGRAAAAIATFRSSPPGGGAGRRHRKPKGQVGP